MVEKNDTLLKLLKKLEGVVGADNIFTSRELLNGFKSAGMVKGKKPLALVKPRTAKMTQELIVFAGKEKINLIFTSSEGSRFRGGTVPSEDGIIVDMSAMKKIVRVDRRNKVALIEPGVTFPELKAAVEKEGLKVLMPLLPRQGKSVLASCLEREPIQVPKYHWDMTDPLLCTELIFGSGDFFRTGSAAGPGTLEQQWKYGGAQKNPLGPAQTDFARVVQGSQGTMAAVTWATVKLEVMPSVHKIFFLTSDNLETLVDFTYRALRPKLGDEFFILNGTALDAVIRRDVNGTKLPGQAPYTIIYAVSGYEYHPEKRVAYQENDLGQIASDLGLHPVRDIPGCSGEKMEEILANCSPEPYYKTAPGGDFLDIFFLTTLDKSSSFIQVMDDVAGKYSYNPTSIGLYIQPIQHGRTVHMEFTLYFDGSVKKEKDKALKFFQEASAELSRAGAFYSRPYGIWSELAYQRCPDTVMALRKIKNMLDPHNILNRGKLCFGEVE